MIYTSGTTGYPKGVMLKHGTILSTLEAITHLLPAREHRTVSLLPASHLFEQAPVMFFGMMIGADILYLRSRNPRVIFEACENKRSPPWWACRSYSSSSGTGSSGKSSARARKSSSSA